MDAVRLCYIAFGLKNIGNTNFKIRARRFLQIVWNNLQNCSADRKKCKLL